MHLNKKRKKNDNEDEIYFKTLRNKEIKFHKFPKYLNYKCINDRNWEFLIDWMIDLHDNASFLQDTLFLSFHIILQYLMWWDYEKANVQLNASTAISLASKIREVSEKHLSLKEYLCDGVFTQKDISENEYTLSIALDWNLDMVTEIDFLSRYGRHCTETEKTFAMFIIEKTFHNLYLVKMILPSLRVMCALYLTNMYYENSKLWTEEIRIESCHSKEDIIKYSEYINNYLINKNEEYHKNKNKGIDINGTCYKKYSNVLKSLQYKDFIIII